MKKRILKLTILAAAFLMCLSGPISAQPKKTPYTKAQLKFAVTPKWYVHYSVIIKGEGGEVVQNGQTVSWKINRRYSGLLALEQKTFNHQQNSQTTQASKNIKLPPDVTLPPEAQQVLNNTAEEIDSIWWTNQTSDFQRIAQAQINDERVSVFADEGGEGGVGKCRESTSEVWTFNNQVITTNTSTLTAKPEKDLLIIGFGFAPFESVGAVPVQFSKKVEGDCSQDEDDENNSTQKLKITEIRIPAAKDILSGNGVRFAFPKGVFDYDADSFQYISPAMPIETEIGGFPNSKGNVGVILELKFSKTPPLEPPPNQE